MRRAWVLLFFASACAGVSPAGRAAGASGPPLALADAAMKGGRYAEAESYYKTAVAEAEKEPADRRLEQSLAALADFYSVRGVPAKAEPLYKKAIGAAEAALGPGDIEVARRARDLALLYHAEGELEGAERYYRRALEVTERALGPGSPEAALRLKDVGSVLQDAGKKREAAPLLERADAILKKAKRR